MFGLINATENQYKNLGIFLVGISEIMCIYYKRICESYLIIPTGLPLSCPYCLLNIITELCNWC